MLYCGSSHALPPFSPPCKDELHPTPQEQLCSPLASKSRLFSVQVPALAAGSDIAPCYE